MKCECGCGEEVKSGNKFIHGHSRRGKHHTEEAKRKASKSHKGQIPWNKGKSFSEETKKKQSEVKLGEKNPMFGRYHTIESKQKISERQDTKEIRQKKRDANSNRIFTEETKQRLSEQKMGENNPMYGKEGTWLGKSHTIESKQKQKEVKLGKLNPNWKNGASFFPYCEKFNEDLKERVRNFFGRCCYVCGIGESELGHKLHVHHVNYDKMVCCNDIKPLFVPLCRSCHMKTNGEREYWEEFFTVSLEYLTQGECFIKK